MELVKASDFFSAGEVTYSTIIELHHCTYLECSPRNTIKHSCLHLEYWPVKIQYTRLGFDIWYFAVFINCSWCPLYKRQLYCVTTNNKFTIPYSDFHSLLKPNATTFVLYETWPSGRSKTLCHIQSHKQHLGQQSHCD